MRTALACLFFLVAAFGTANGQGRAALVIGIGQYRYIPALRTPAGDARAMGDMLRSAGFDVSVVTDADAGALRRAVLAFTEAKDRADLALVYFSGHATQVDGRNLLLPVDAEIDNPAASGLELDWLLSRLPASRTGKASIVLLDACRSLPAAAGGATRSIAPRGIAPLLLPQRNMLVAVAASPGEVAADGDGPYSLFTTALLSHLPVRGRSVEQAIRQVSRDVLAMSAGRQRPFEISTLVTEVHLAPQAHASTGSPAPSANPAAEAEAQARAAAEEARRRAEAEARMKAEDARKRADASEGERRKAEQEARARAEAEARAAEQKRLAEAKAAEDARRAEAARRAAEEQRKAAETRAAEQRRIAEAKAAEDARRAEETRKVSEEQRKAAEARAAEPKRGAEAKAAEALPNPCAKVACTPVSVFFGSDRLQQPHPERIDLGGKRAGRLQLGAAVVTVPRIERKIGDVARPRWWERWFLRVPASGTPDKHFTLPANGVRLYATEQEFLNAVRAHAATSISFKEHAFVFVHGFQTTFENALYRTAQLAYDLGSDGQPFGTAYLYSWPSGGAMADYKYDFDSARFAVGHLSRFLRIVADRTGAQHVHLIAHSMGSWPLLDALGRTVFTTAGKAKLNQIVLAAPDIDAAEFQRMASRIRPPVVKGVTLYASSSDAAMLASRQLHRGEPRAGDIPETGPVLMQGVDTIDISAISTAILSLAHSDYAAQRELLNDIALVLRRGERPPPKRTPILQTIRANDREYWRYPPN